MRDHLIPSHLRLASAIAVGACLAVLAFLRITLPIWPLIAQMQHFSLPERATLLVKLFAPLLSFALASGWVFFFLWAGDFLLLRSLLPRQTGAGVTRSMPPEGGEEAEKQEALAPPAHPDHEAVARGAEKQEDEPSSVPVEQKAHRLEKLPLALEASASDEAPQQDEPPSPVTVPPRGQDELLLEGGSLSQGDKEPGNAASESLEEFFFQSDDALSPNAPPVRLTLLKQVRLWVLAQDGTRREVRLRSGENCLRLIVFAYIAWRQGEQVDRDKLMTHVIARGKRQDYDVEQLSQVFDAAKKYLRQDLSKALRELKEAGHPLSTSDIDLFSNDAGFYWLHPACQVMDLGRIEKEYQTVQRAREQGLLDEKLDGTLPDWVVTACENVRRAYTGDFLQSLLEKHPDSVGSWVREPLTSYRDKYLDALLLLANHESALGRNFVDDQMSEAERTQQRRAHIAKAAQRYYDYASSAITSKWDSKLTFAYRSKLGKDGERVVMAARALRRCVVELGKLGRTDMIDQVYLSFKQKMARLSDGHWVPDSDTEHDVAEAKKTTGAYRFTAQVQAVTRPRERPVA